MEPPYLSHSMLQMNVQAHGQAQLKKPELNADDDLGRHISQHHKIPAPDHQRYLDSCHYFEKMLILWRW